MVKVTHKKTIATDEKQEKTGKLLKSMREQSEEEAAAEIARQYDLPYIDLNIFPVSGEDMRAISEEESRANRLVVFQKTGKEIRIGITSPQNPETFSYLEKLKSEKIGRASCRERV